MPATSSSATVLTDFFFQSYGDYRDLHSFPTRRSSDLNDGGTKHPGDFGNLAHEQTRAAAADRKSTRLNSSHLGISYAVFCLKKKKWHTAARLVRALRSRVET